MKTAECVICRKQVSVCGIKKHIERHKTEKPCGFCGKMVAGKKKFCNSSCAARYNNNRKGTGKVNICVWKTSEG
jgi:predicted nucleic acid-binding Zn ribbon protein